MQNKTNELKLKLERLAALKAQLASFIEYDRWEEVYCDGRENASLPVEIVDDLIEALETAFALHAEAEEQAAADAEDAADELARNELYRMLMSS